MKKLLGGLALTALFFAGCNNASTEKKEVELVSSAQKVSYGLGASYGMDLLRQGMPADSVDAEAFKEGVLDAINEVTLKLDDQEISAEFQAFFTKLRKAQEVKDKEQYAEVIAQSEAYLAANAQKEGVITTSSGLQYEVITEGKGAMPVATSQVTVHYHGTTPDGTVFDSSVERGETISFALNQVIKGWTEGLQLMKEGAKYRFVIPEYLAYGANPRPGGPIKPYMTLIFEVELFKVEN